MPLKIMWKPNNCINISANYQSISSSLIQQLRVRPSEDVLEREECGSRAASITPD